MKMGLHYTGVFRISQRLCCKRWLPRLSSLHPAQRPPTTFSNERRRLSTDAHTEGGPLRTQCLTHRTLIRLNGSDTWGFLQGLLTNDMMCLQAVKVDCAKTLYTLMLNVQGRVLYDLILYAVEKKKSEKVADTELLMECDIAVAEELMGTLRRYKIRKKVNMAAVGDELRVWAVIPTAADQVAWPTDTHPMVVSLTDPEQVVMCEVDPRLKALGHRLILPAGVNASSVLAHAEDTAASHYTQHRYQLGVAEGSTELPPGGCFPLESNAAFLNGVSFNKGCYIGQELTARTFHTGLTRKRIMPLKLGSDVGVPEKASLQNAAGKKCGTLRGHSGVLGLGLLRIPDTVGKGPLTVIKGSKDKSPVTTATAHIPTWWPLETDSLLKQVTSDYPDSVPPKVK